MTNLSKTRIGPSDVSRLLVCSMTLWMHAAIAQKAPVSPSSDDLVRTQLVEPFHIIDGIYFVGATLHFPSYLFTTPEGHILIDSTDEENVPQIVSNIKKAGFSVDDIRILLSSHAHHDHVGGHASMREITGARTMATALDAEVIESGGELDFRDRGLWAPAEVDELIEDGDEIRLGDRVLKAHLTPGHTRGCTTWTTVVEEKGSQYDLILLCGVRVNTGVPLVGNTDFPDMPQQFAYTFARLKIMPVDVYLGAHGYWFDVEEKYRKLQAGATTNPFIDPEGYRKAILGWEQAYLERLQKELGISAANN